MNRMVKVGFTALALAAMTPAFSQEQEAVSENPKKEVVSEGTVGWTPVVVGLATPVQLPWGTARWDVYGLDFNVFYSDAPLMYGLDFGGLAALTRNEMMGLQVGGLFNYGLADVYGLRVTLGLNLCASNVYGAELGMLSMRESLCGFDANFLGSGTRKMCGFQVSGLINLTSDESYGCAIAGLANLAKTAYGVQLAALYNMTDELHGCQIGLVNYADYCPNGFQIGLVNIILSNQIKVLPFVNGYF